MLRLSPQILTEKGRLVVELVGALSPDNHIGLRKKKAIPSLSVSDLEPRVVVDAMSEATLAKVNSSSW